MQSNRVLNRALAVLFAVVLLPATAHGQGQIAGRVTGNTGGVLPGVAVKASSPRHTTSCAGDTTVTRPISARPPVSVGC